MADRRVFFATVQSHLVGAVEPKMVMIGARAGKTIRNDGNEEKGDASAIDIYATMKEIEKAKTCVFHWHPIQDAPKREKYFTDAKKQKDVFHAFMIFLYIEGQAQNRFHLKKAKVADVKPEMRFGGELVWLTCDSVEIIKTQ
jgi:hypothetical protein